MNRAGQRRLQRIVDQACDPARKPLTHEERMEHLATLYSPRGPRQPDLLFPLAPPLGESVRPDSPVE